MDAKRRGGARNLFRRNAPTTRAGECRRASQVLSGAPANGVDTTPKSAARRNEFRAPIGAAAFRAWGSGWLALGFTSLLLCLNPIARAADWPHWRGPDRNGTSAETGWRRDWPADGLPIAWRAKAGLGFSSFAVSQGRVFTLGHNDGQDTVYCWEADTGKEVWKHSYPSELGDKFFDGGTTGTPTVEGDQVYTLSRWGDLFCFQAADGKILWSKNVQKETGAPIPMWGFGGSPLIHGDLLVLNVGDAGLGLEKKSGAIRWQSAKKDAGYSTVQPFQQGGRWLGVLGSGQSYVAVDLRDGREMWRIPWITEYGVNAADPILTGDHVFLSTGYKKGAGYFKLDGVSPGAEWKSKVLRTQLNPAVLRDGHLYGVDGDTTDTASLKCVELASGKQKWTQPGFGSGGLIIVDGQLIALSGSGELMLAPAATDAFSPTARFQVLGGKCWTAPVLANGRILCRNSRGEIACVDARMK